MRSSPIILVLWDVCKIIFTLCENLTLNLFSFSSARFSPDDKYSRHRVTLKRRFGILPTQQAKPVYWDTKKFCLMPCRKRLLGVQMWRICQHIFYVWCHIMSFKIISVIVVINIKFQKYILSKEFLPSTRLIIVPSH